MTEDTGRTFRVRIQRDDFCDLCRRVIPAGEDHAHIYRSAWPAYGKIAPSLVLCAQCAGLDNPKEH